MPIERSEAFILYSFNFSEQDKIVTFFTRDKGIIKGIAKGARKFGNRFGSSLEPMSFVQIVYYEKERRDLVMISQCDLQESFFDVQNNIKATFTLGYFSELIQEFLPLRSTEDLVFRLLLKTFKPYKKAETSSLSVLILKPGC
jgi:DNA repair protein RecO (recombination protein O)